MPYNLLPSAASFLSAAPRAGKGLIPPTLTITSAVAVIYYGEVSHDLRRRRKDIKYN